jgi:hypothetical protein
MSKEWEAVRESLDGNFAVAQHRCIILSFGGDRNVAAVFEQLLYWQGKGSDEEGWIYKTYEEWEQEIFLSQYYVKKGIDKLQSIGIVSTKRKRLKDGTNPVHYLMDLEKVQGWIEKARQEYPDPRKSNISFPEQASRTEIKKSNSSKSNISFPGNQNFNVDYDAKITNKDYVQEGFTAAKDCTREPESLAAAAPAPASTPGQLIYFALREICKISDVKAQIKDVQEELSKAVPLLRRMGATPELIGEFRVWFDTVDWPGNTRLLIKQVPMRFEDFLEWREMDLEAERREAEHKAKKMQPAKERLGLADLTPEQREAQRLEKERASQQIKAFRRGPGPKVNPDSRIIGREEAKAIKREIEAKGSSP